VRGEGETEGEGGWSAMAPAVTAYRRQVLARGGEINLTRYHVGRNETLIH
jgi:hypothetical protein